MTEAELRAVMGGQCNNCAAHLPYVNEALGHTNMSCPLRTAAFLAQVRHETQGFTSFFQSADFGAGAIHMLPANFRKACRELDPPVKRGKLQAAFQQAFPSCPTAWNGDPCACGGDWEAAQIVQRSEWAFITAAWWFVKGAQEVLGGPCGDLRLDADTGYGIRETVYHGKAFPGTGYFKISTCVFGFQVDSGLDQRTQYYVDARRAFTPTYSAPPDPHGPCISDHHLLTLPQLTAAMGGQCSTCNADMIGHINVALSEAVMNCKARTAAFLAHVRAETQNLQSFYNGQTSTAGAIGLSPTAFRLACRHITSLGDSFALQFAGCTTASTDPCACGTDRQAAEVIGQRLWAFRVAAWWFVKGATAVMGTECGDLRFDADLGAGVEPAQVGSSTPGTGFAKTSTCVLGFLPNSNRALRLAYYDDAIAALNDDSASSSSADDNQCCKGGSVLISGCEPANGGGFTTALCGVATPVITPTAGKAPLKVDIFTTTTGSEADFHLFVSTDGVEPKCDGTAVGAVFKFIGTAVSLTAKTTTTYKAVACRSGLQDSPVATAKVTVSEDALEAYVGAVGATVKLVGLKKADWHAGTRYNFRLSVQSALKLATVERVRQDADVIDAENARRTLRPRRLRSGETVFAAVADLGTQAAAPTEQRRRRLVDAVLVPFRVLMVKGETASDLVSKISAVLVDGTLHDELVAKGVVASEAQVAFSAFPKATDVHGEQDLSGGGGGNADEDDGPGWSWDGMMADCDTELGVEGCLVIKVILGLLLGIVLVAVVVFLACGAPSGSICKQRTNLRKLNMQRAESSGNARRVQVKAKGKGSRRGHEEPASKYEADPWAALDQKDAKRGGHHHRSGDQDTDKRRASGRSKGLSESDRRATEGDAPDRRLSGERERGSRRVAPAAMAAAVAVAAGHRDADEADMRRFASEGNVPTRQLPVPRGGADMSATMPPDGTRGRRDGPLDGAGPGGPGPGPHDPRTAALANQAPQHALRREQSERSHASNATHASVALSATSFDTAGGKPRGGEREDPTQGLYAASPSADAYGAHGTPIGGSGRVGRSVLEAGPQPSGMPGYGVGAAPAGGAGYGYGASVSNASGDIAREAEKHKHKKKKKKKKKHKHDRDGDRERFDGSVSDMGSGSVPGAADSGAAAVTHTSALRASVVAAGGRGRDDGSTDDGLEEVALTTLSRQSDDGNPRSAGRSPASVGRPGFVPALNLGAVGRK